MEHGESTEAMQYQGGKHVAGAWIEQHLLEVGKDCTIYAEPFVGGASVAARMATHFDDVRLGDVREDLILFWQAICSGWEPPNEVSEQEYAELETAEPSPLRGFVGFCCSFGGGWFNGYARNKTGKSYADMGVRSCTKKAVRMKHARWVAADYREWNPEPGWLMYLDPPYADTRGYKIDFDSTEFWGYAAKWADAGAVIVVSEYKAPEGWRELDRRETPATMAGTSGLKQLEKLWVRA